MYNECMGTVTSDGHSPVTQRGFCYDTLPNPTIDGNVILVGEGTGEFMATISGLSIGKLYFVRAFATNSEGTSYGEQIHFLAGCDTKTLTDYDGNIYNTVTVGTQCWMKENLKTTHYSDGWPLSNTDYKYANNDINNFDTYGLLYTWDQVMRNEESSNSIPSGVQGICPLGWHVPSKAEFEQLKSYVSSRNEYQCNGNSNNIAKSLADSVGWQYSNDQCHVGNNISTNNATGFSALPSGYVSWSGPWYYQTQAHFWTSTYHHTDFGTDIFACKWQIIGSTTSLNNHYAACQLSVRCLRD